VLGAGAEDQEFGRQRRLARVDERIDAVGIGLQHRAGLGRCLREDRLCIAPHAQCAQEAVGLERAGTQDFGKTARDDALVHLHLPEAVLRVDVAKRVVGIERIGRLDMRHGVAVSHHHHAVSQAGQSQGAGHVWLRRLPVPDIAADRPGCRQQHDAQQSPAQPFQPAHPTPPIGKTQ
jgi:hypothetical protein